MQYRGLYIGVLFALIALVLLSLGKGFWGGDATGRHFTEMLFSGVCHQMTERSIHIGGEPMAVNSRCFGIFLGLLLSWMMIPAFKNLRLKKSAAIRILFFAVMLQIIDYTGNLFHLWENTNLSRALLGGVLGWVSFIVIADHFKPLNKID
jgi:uncharacterized membrane protein